MRYFVSERICCCHSIPGHQGLIKFLSLTALPVVLLLLTFSCIRPGESGRNGFTLMDAGTTHIDFENQINYTEEFNTYTYRNFYNGAGVGIADFNCDGKQDIFFCSNQTGNKLYINTGDFHFEDITVKAGVECRDSWNTGVSIADVNGDGWPDLYISKSGMLNSKSRHNELFINNGVLTLSNTNIEGLNYTLTITTNHTKYVKPLLLEGSVRTTIEDTKKTSVIPIHEP